MQERIELPIADLSMDDFGVKFDHALADTGFAAVRCYEGIVPGLGNLKRELYAALAWFMSLPINVKRKYIIPNIGGQRGYTENGTEQSGGAEFTESREHFMTGPKIPLDHPIRQYQRHRFYLDNPVVPEVPELISLAERLYDAIDDLDFAVYEKAAVALGLPPGYFNCLLAWGDSSVRMHCYPALAEDVKILGTEMIKGVEALVVEFPDGKRINNFVRAGKHTDVDFSAVLLGAEAPGLNIETRDGRAVPYTTKADFVVINAGDYAKHMTGNKWPSSPHWVSINPETARMPRYSIVRFTHTRSGVILNVAKPFRTDEAVKNYPPEYEGVLLATRLCEIGYFTPEVRDNLIDTVRNKLKPDDELVAEIISWERANGVRKITKYVDNMSQYREIYQLAA